MHGRTLVLTLGLLLPLASSTGRMLLLADVHMDSLYSSGLSSACKCEARYDEDGTCAEGATLNPFGQFGCDASPALVESALRAAADTLPDFVIFGGDYMSHASPSADATLAAIASVTELLDTHFGSSSSTSTSWRACVARSSSR